MNFLYYDHQGKGKPFYNTLISKGWSRTAQEDNAHIVLYDAEINRHEQIKRLHKKGKPVFIYPHAARPDLLPDFKGYSAAPDLTAHFVITEGHVEIMEAYGYPHPMPVVGWSMCPIEPFRERERARQVLFAPIHSSRSGAMSKIDRAINEATFKVLHQLVKEDQIELIVRYLYNIKFTGVPEEVEDVTYVKGSPDMSYAMIDRADVVVSHQTFAHIAVARGVPTVMMAENVPPRYTVTTGDYVLCRSWDKYAHLLRFPLDILRGNDPYKVLEDATKSRQDVADWRERMIGNNMFDPLKFMEVVNAYL